MVWYLSESKNWPFARNCLTMELAYTRHFVGLELPPVCHLSVFHANLLECVKSMPITVSSQHSLHLWLQQFVWFEALLAASLPGSEHPRIWVVCITLLIPCGNVTVAEAMRDGALCRPNEQFTEC